jgi:uncharacterized protein (TIGR04255 family)
VTAGSQSPSFDTPPVSQVSLEAHFESLARVRTAHFGLFWAAIGGEAKYPDTDDLFPDQIEVEKPDIDAERPRINFEFSGRPPGTRSRFSNPDSRVEIQENALVAAWHGEPCSGSYPRYASVRDHFTAMLAAWRKIVADSRLGELHLVQTEIHYRNHILLGSGWDRADQIRGDVLQVNWLPTAGDLATEDMHVYQRHVIRGDDDQFLGRLYMSIDSAQEYKGTKSLDFALTVRQPLTKDTPEAVMAGLDAGHDLIVHTFAKATTERMHHSWGRRS